MKFVLSTFAAVAIKAVAGSCIDDNSNCASWAAQGECTKSAGFMMTSCKKSCNACDPTPPPTPSTCLDLDNSCGTYAQQGWCTRNTNSFMKTNCKKSCNNCTGPSPGPTPTPTGSKVKVALNYSSWDAASNFTM